MLRVLDICGDKCKFEEDGQIFNLVVTEMVTAESNTVLHCGYYVLSKKKKNRSRVCVSCDANFQVSLFLDCVKV